MLPHCDTMDGPVVLAAKKSLETGNVNLILPWVPKRVEGELRKAFEKTLQVRKLSDEAQELADYWFFETAVRLHREGEGAPYTGLKPAGLDWGPVVPKAHEAIEKGDTGKVVAFLLHTVREVLQEKFRRAMEKKSYDESGVDAAREYIQAMLDFILFSHHLYVFVTDKGNHGRGEAEHQH